ncbi:MAG: serine hydrolase [Candidatus Krumholzibacteria bacterium]
MKLWRALPVVAALLLLTPNASWVYPIDGYVLTGIRRLERLRLRLVGELDGTVPVGGGRQRIADIWLHAVRTGGAVGNTAPGGIPAGDAPIRAGGLDTDFPEPDAALSREIERLFSDRDPSYSLALLEITPGRPMRFASMRPDVLYSPGSVGKLAIAVGLFAELARRYPDDVDSRQTLLRNREVTAGKWIVQDHHKVPLFDPDTREVGFRRIRQGDVFSLYEWLDHMLSASANAAASTVWKEVMLMRVFGRDYPPAPAAEDSFFTETPRAELQKIAVSVVNDPLRELGIGEDEWRQGSFFTRAGKRIVPGVKSYASPRALLLFLLRIEQGRVVDVWSSLELKRLMYMTEKRIRYASSPALAEAAVYFKSGSLYRCKKEPGFQCGKYQGNVDNYMNSVAIVEKPDGRLYLVALMSNVLKINSAVEHQTLATYIDRILAR